METIDPAECRYLEDENTPTMKVVKTTIGGLVAGGFWGTVVAAWNDMHRIERGVPRRGLIRTLKMMRNHGLTFAAVGFIYTGVEELLQNYRMKRDLFNGAVGGFVAGATVIGYKGRGVSSAVSAGSALAIMSAYLDWGNQAFKTNMDKEYYAYTTKKRPSANN